MSLELKLHPDSRCAAATHIDVDVARLRAGVLELRYTVTGAMDDLRLPPASAPERTDELWRHTCFEAFVRAQSGDAYAEFNFAPSTQWAAYQFTSHRTGMVAATALSAPRIDVHVGAGSCQVRVALNVSPLLSLKNDAIWRLGLAAVIEETSGRTSYWALAHPPGAPDFHHADSFAYELAAAEPS